MQETALALMDKIGVADNFSLSLFDESWHQGVIGILAARLRERYHRPAKEGVCDVCGASDFLRRPDDQPESVKTRFEVYRRQTAPILPYYRDRGILKTEGQLTNQDGELVMTIRAVNFFGRRPQAG